MLHCHLESAGRAADSSVPGVATQYIRLDDRSCRTRLFTLSMESTTAPGTVNRSFRSFKSSRSRTPRDPFLARSSRFNALEHNTDQSFWRSVLVSCQLSQQTWRNSQRAWYRRAASARHSQWKATQLPPPRSGIDHSLRRGVEHCAQVITSRQASTLSASPFHGRGTGGKVGCGVC